MHPAVVPLAGMDVQRLGVPTTAGGDVEHQVVGDVSAADSQDGFFATILASAGRALLLLFLSQGCV
jgi:hypothetical protein